LLNRWLWDGGCGERQPAATLTLSAPFGPVARHFVDYPNLPLPSATFIDRRYLGPARRARRNSLSAVPAMRAIDQWPGDAACHAMDYLKE